MSALLQSLAPTGRRLVTQELVTGQLQRHAATAWRDHVQPLSHAIELEQLDLGLAQIMSVVPQHSSQIDARAAVAIHRALPISRRVAADPGVFRFLAVVHQPAFVRHRYEFQSWATMRDRFWRAGLRHDCNTFSRLWWIAELTVIDGDYSLTERAFSTQSVAIQVFIRKFAHYRPAAAACIEALEQQPGGIVERVLPRFNAYLSTVPLEGQDQAQLRVVLDELIDLAWDERADDGGG
ncbi:hypothetical protein DB30_03824 [Enhygromyxa salina]|uniref:Uncharacterized protein n=1 Tax=Enhygromyxa salina TaxID=215803 RepID=A0A0C2A768_9BACT|nr:DUF6339 family protein [Enhygromyxa salina]KIG19268.1 hypothetical protein DB30_03824 [Enhygromyxa salina]